MRYLRVVEDQGRYVASLPETLPPTPTRGEVLIRVTASGVNRADLSQIAGRYPPPAGESEILGLEVSGTLDETGEPVCALLAGGGHAECVAAPVGQVFPAPAGLDLVTAAGIPEAFLTAFVNLIVEGGLEREAAVLVHAGASGVGLAAIQIAKLSGARVAATTRTADKRKAIEAMGADLAIDSARQDFAGEIERRWGRDAVDVVLDPVGASSLAGDLRVLKAGGRIVMLSTMSGSEAGLDLAFADAEARADRGLDAPGPEPPRESSDRGPVQGGAPPAVHRRSPARRGRFSVSSGAGGGSVSAHAREPQRGQDPDRLATRLMYLSPP